MLNMSVTTEDKSDFSVLNGGDFLDAVFSLGSTNGYRAEPS